MKNSKLRIDNLSERLVRNLEKVIIGKRDILTYVVVCLFANGHLLIEDVPGTGKTMLAKALAKSLNCSFSRIQFTPDMLPSDVTGVSIYDQVKKKFQFNPGPIFSNIVLADEINRATPKTQSALLEVMEEKQVTTDGITRTVELPFLVMGTQNPIEYEGTFPLPEAQLDRFLLRVALGYPSPHDEVKIMDSQQYNHPIESLTPVCTKQEIIAVQEAIKSVRIANPVKRYISDLSSATRKHVDIYLGVSPRASLGLYRSGQVLAAINKRDFLLPDDIKDLARFIFPHRMIIQPSTRIQERTAEDIVNEIVELTPIPPGNFREEQ